MKFNSAMIVYTFEFDFNGSHIEKPIMVYERRVINGLYAFVQHGMTYIILLLFNVMWKACLRS